MVVDLELLVDWVDLGSHGGLELRISKSVLGHFGVVRAVVQEDNLRLLALVIRSPLDLVDSPAGFVLGHVVLEVLERRVTGADLLNNN